MNGAIRWFVDNGVAANLMMLLVLAGGFLALGSLKQEIIPEIQTDRILVSVVYPGATPAEVEKSICVRIEEEVASLQDIKRLSSVALEGMGRVTIELIQGSDINRALNNVKARVDAIDTFPDEAERPVVREIIAARQVINVTVSADADEKSLKVLGERVRDDIINLPGITRATLTNVRPYEVSIEVSESRLRKYGLTFQEVATAVRGSSLDLPGGSIKADEGELLLRALGQAYRGSDFERLVLRTSADGARVLLGDVASVVDGFEEVEGHARFDRKPSVMVRVFRVGDQRALEVAAAVKEYLAEAKSRLPPEVELTTWQDDSRILRGRLDLLIRNGITGFALVLLSLALFLRFRLAAWVTAGIPISFLGALWLMPGLGASINLISLFAFIVVLGIVVDDAIVIGENIMSHLEKGEPPLEAAKNGAAEMSTPVIFAVLTTIAAFSAMLGIGGMMGQFARQIPIVVICALSFSLIESLLILPVHLRHVRLDKGRTWFPLWERVQGVFSGGLELFIRRVYTPLLDRSLNWRYLTLSLGIALFLVTLALPLGGWLKLTFYPAIDADNVGAMLTMPTGTSMIETARNVSRLEESAYRLEEELNGQNGDQIVRHVMASFGSQPFRTTQMQNAGNLVGVSVESNLGEVTLELAPSERRKISSKAIARRWRELTGPIPGATELAYSASLMPAGEAINIQLSSNDTEELNEACRRLVAELGRYQGVHDIADSFRIGKEEVRLTMRPEAEQLGLRLSDLAVQVRQAFWGEEAQRIQRGRDDVAVMVRLPRGERRSLQGLENLRIRTRERAEVPLSTVAELHLDRGLAVISRADRRRSVNVTADVDTDQANANEILRKLTKDFLPELESEFAGLGYSFEGQERNNREFMRDMLQQGIVCLVVIFALLAIPLRSYVQPMIIMSVIPFGIIGAIWGHVLMGMDLTMMSMIGLIALTGVVVNDSLVVVDFVNRRLRLGESLEQAIRTAGAARFRPILLTSLTTFASLTPMLLERSIQAQFLIPMAVSLGFGIIFATVITLFFVPCVYQILNDMGTLGSRCLIFLRGNDESNR
ncbi:MAG: efflux RND transporter permease subunit [Planctomycetota bacterium]